MIETGPQLMLRNSDFSIHMLEIIQLDIAQVSLKVMFGSMAITNIE